MSGQFKTVLVWHCGVEPDVTTAMFSMFHGVIVLRKHFLLFRNSNQEAMRTLST